MADMMFNTTQQRCLWIIHYRQELNDKANSVSVVSHCSLCWLTHLWQINEHLHALVRAHVSDVTEVGWPRDEPRLAVCPTTQNSDTIIQHSQYTTSYHLQYTELWKMSNMFTMIDLSFLTIRPIFFIVNISETGVFYLSPQNYAAVNGQQLHLVVNSRSYHSVLMEPAEHQLKHWFYKKIWLDFYKQIYILLHLINQPNKFIHENVY